MPNPMMLAGFPDILDSRFGDVFDGRYAIEKDRVPDFYTVVKPTQVTEKGTRLTDGPAFQDFSLLGRVTYGAPEQGYDWSSTYKHFALGTQVEKDLLMYDQHDVIEGRWEFLADSARDYRLNDAARIFNQAFTIDTRFYNHTEGVALCSNSHTTVIDGVSTSVGFDNLITSAFSPTSLKAALIQFRKFKSDQGRIIDGLMPDTLVGSIDLETDFLEVMQTELGFEPERFGESTKNVLQDKYRLINWARISSTTNWFLLDSKAMKRNLVWFEAQPLQRDRAKDLDTMVAKYVADMYYHTAYKDWRWILGSQVS